MDAKDLDFFLEQGEGQFIEFKEFFDSSIRKEIVAFANAAGGKILLGVTDNSEVKGIDTLNSLRSKVYDLAKNCDPSINIELSAFENILIVDVKEGLNKPYSCKDGFYMRIGPNSQKMNRNDILKLAIKEGKIRYDEQICKEFEWNDFDNDKFEYYLKLAGISNSLSKEDILTNLKVLSPEGMTNAGVLYFAKNPHKYIITSKVRCVHFRDNDRVEILDKKEVDRGIIGNIEFAINYIKELVPVRYKIEKLSREEFPEFPEKAYREAIINAIIHFDYFEGSNIAIEKLKNSIFINNKGRLLFDEKEFGRRSELRNRLLADLLSRTEYMERVGTGIKRIKKACELNGNKVKFSFSDAVFVEFFSNSKHVLSYENDTVNGTVNDPVNDTVNSILAEIKKDNSITLDVLATKVGKSRRTIIRYIEELKNRGVIYREGSDKKGFWRVK